MKREPFSKTDLKQIQRQLSAWRKKKIGGSRIPEELWMAATQLAKTQGTGLVARVLRLDYYKLRERVRGMVSSLPTAGFVEVKGSELASLGPEESVIEFCDGRGGRMSLKVRADLSMLTALVQSFWRRSP